MKKAAAPFNDFLSKVEPFGFPCRVTFFWGPFNDEMRKSHSASLDVNIDNGDVQSVVDALKNGGGAWMPSKVVGNEVWFYPWPPAAIRVRPVVKDKDA